ncbi:MAG: GTP-binding protein [Candidatus Hodarchaeota archaeon]
MSLDLERLKKVYDIFKICLAGDGAVGKTSFLNYLRTGKFIPNQGNIKRTPFINIDGCALGGHKIQLYDLAGQRRKDAHPLDFLQIQVFKELDSLILFFSLNNLQSFINIKTWYEEVRRIYETWNESLPPMFLVGNKLDMPRKVESINGEALVNNVKEFNGYYEISLVSGENVLDLLNGICEMLDSRAG